MRARSSIVVAMLLVVLSAGLALAKGQVGGAAPAFALVGRDGKTVRLADLKGKVVIVDFWASWCKPCKRELPVLDGLAARYAGQPVVFVAINIDGERKNAERTLAELKITRLTVLFDPTSKVVEAYEPPTMPTSYVIDQRGVVRLVNVGYADGDAAKLTGAIDGLLRK